MASSHLTGPDLTSPSPPSPFGFFTTWVSGGEVSNNSISDGMNDELEDCSHLPSFIEQRDFFQKGIVCPIPLRSTRSMLNGFTSSGAVNTENGVDISGVGRLDFSKMTQGRSPSFDDFGIHGIHEGGFNACGDFVVSDGEGGDEEEGMRGMVGSFEESGLGSISRDDLRSVHKQFSRSLADNLPPPPSPPSPPPPSPSKHSMPTLSSPVLSRGALRTYLKRSRGKSAKKRQQMQEKRLGGFEEMSS